MIARIVARILALATVIGALALGATLAVERPAATAAGTTVTVTPARQDAACPGPLVTPASTAATDPELGGAATGVRRSVFLEGSARDVGNGSASDAVVGSQVESVTGGDITGLAALTCGRASTDQWIVAGTTSLGASARLVLTNPSRAAVEATIVVHGELGELDSRKVAIGPEAQQEVLLEGVAVNVSSLALHVTSTGTGVVAALQDSRLNGFQPYGTDWATASAVGTDLAIPGVGTQGSATQAAAVRLVAPTGATVRLGLSTPDGPALWEGVASLTLDPGVAVDIAVPAVDVGTVTISADAPVAAGAFVARTAAATAGVEGDTVQEFRWLPAQPAADTDERATVTVGYDEQVVVYAASRGTFTLTDAQGETLATAALTPGGTAAIPLAVPAGTTVTAKGAFAWSVLVADGDHLAALSPARTTVDDINITVRQRRYMPLP